MPWLYSRPSQESSCESPIHRYRWAHLWIRDSGALLYLWIGELTYLWIGHTGAYPHRRAPVSPVNRSCESCEWGAVRPSQDSQELSWLTGLTGPIHSHRSFLWYTELLIGAFLWVSAVPIRRSCCRCAEVLSTGRRECVGVGCVCMYTHIGCVCTHMQHIHTHPTQCVCVYVCCMCVHTGWMCVCVYVCMCVCVECVCMYTRILHVCAMTLSCVRRDSLKEIVDNSNNCQ